MRQIGGDRVGRFIDSCKAFDGALAHEALHFRDAALIDARRDIDEYDRAENWPAALAFGFSVCQKRSHAAKRSSDRNRAPSAARCERSGNRGYIRRKIRKLVGSV